MSKAREEIGRTRNKTSTDPATLAIGVSEAFRNVGTTLDRLNSQFLESMTKISEMAFKRLPTGENTSTGFVVAGRAGEEFRRKQAGTDGTGIGTTFEGARDKFGDTARAMSGTGNELASGLEKTFSRFFENEFKGELRTAENSWKSFCSSLESVFSKTLSKLAGNWMQKAFQGIFNGVFGAGGFSSGSDFTAARTGFGDIFPLGIDFSTNAGSVKPFVEGITKSEAGVRADRQMQAAAADRPPLVVNIELTNQSGVPVKAEQGPVRYDLEKAVVGVVLKNYNEGGSIWQMIRGEKAQG